MALLLILLASCFASSSNFCLRRSIDSGGSSRAYLVIQPFFSFVIAIFLSPVRTGCYEASAPSLLLGVVAGLILFVMMWSLGRAAEKGPPGLTFASLNSATVMPAIVMVFAFGPSWGYAYGASNAVGSLMVVGGLIWAGWQLQSTAGKRHWALLVAMMFVAHVALLVMLQWRALMLIDPVNETWLIPFHLTEQTSQWFFPVMFLCVTLFQLVSFVMQGERRMGKKELFWGLVGGMTNGCCTFLLIKAPEVAQPWENAMLFPLFAVAVILVTNLWSQFLYKERINWVANGLCVGGLVVGTIEWSAFLA